MDIIRKFLIATFLFVVCTISSTANATLITSSNSIRIDYQTAFSFDPGGFTGIRYFFRFDPNGDRLDYGEGWAVTAFDEQGLTIGSSDYSQLSYVYGGNSSIGLGLGFDASPIENGIGYLLFDSIVGSFDLIDVEIELLYTTNSRSSSINNVQNEVSIATVPNPATVYLVGIGLVGLIGVAKRKKI